MLRSAALLLAVLLGTLRALAAEAEVASGAPELDAEAASEPNDAWRAPGPAGPFGGDVPAARARGLSLGVRAGMARSPGERQRVFGVLELSIGLDDWVGARAERADELAVSDAESANAEVAELAPAATGASPLLDSGSLEPGAASAGADEARGLASDAVRGEHGPPPAPTRHDAPLSDARSGLAAARLARALVAEALRVNGSAAELRRLDGMASRSRAAASLPEVRLGAGTASDESLRMSPTVSDPARFTRDGGRDVWVEARLTWRLDSAIFARDEIAIMRLRAQRQEESGRLAREVVEALVDWRKANLVQTSPLALPEERDAASIRQFGAAARLDVLTDGWFSRYLERWGPRAGAALWP